MPFGAVRGRGGVSFDFLFSLNIIRGGGLVKITC